MKRNPLAVDETRWRQAQSCQKAFWLRQERNQRRGWRRIIYPIARPFLLAIGSKKATGDDWNEWWRYQFEGYSFLPNELGDVIELGCGPYTNIRLLLAGRKASRIVCSDPLANEYIRFRDRWLARAYRAGKVEVDDHPIEFCPFPAESFDLVVLIDVLDYVQDAGACLETAERLLRDGGFFVFGQDVADKSMTGEHAWFDETHPIRLEAKDVEPYLSPFDALLKKELHKAESRDPQMHSGTLIFAGVKRSVP